MNAGIESVKDAEDSRLMYLAQTVQRLKVTKTMLVKYLSNESMLYLAQTVLLLSGPRCFTLTVLCKQQYARPQGVIAMYKNYYAKQRNA